MTRGYGRRSILAGFAGAGLMTFDEWLAGSASAAPPVALARTRTRYEASSPQGQKMLLIYHDAVRKMVRTRARLPCSWTFQWYTHFVKGSTTKAAEIAAIYGSGNSSDKALAEAMWDTCQAHGGQAPQDESWFLPWHRMYVFYFESIVRKVSGKPEFTLPYWNYSDPATRTLPAPFRQASSPLFRTNRNPGVNTGASIPASQVVLTAMSETSYDPQGAASGFNQAIDFGIHGNIHVWVGNQQGMGQIPWAAFDPVFWMHHCNVDRLWASWNKGGRTNPGGAWLNQEFTFADADCKKVTMKNGDVDDTAKLHYEYDHYESVPRLVALAPAAAPNPFVRLESVAPAGIAAGGAGVIALGAGPTRVPLTAPPAASVAGQPRFAARMSALPAEAPAPTRSPAWSTTSIWTRRRGRIRGRTTPTMSARSTSSPPPAWGRCRGCLGAACNAPSAWTSHSRQRRWRRRDSFPTRPA
jgi:tyrosinase